MLQIRHTNHSLSLFDQLFNDQSSFFPAWNELSLNKMNYHSYFCSDQYRKKQLKMFWEASKEEFIAVTWHPDRVDRGWCLDEDEKKERLEFYGI